MSSPGRRPDRRHALMRAVHAACRELGLDEEARHDLQLAVTGKASMTMMTAADLSRLLDRLNGRSSKESRDRPVRRRHPKASRGDLRLIHAIWGELGRRGALRQPGREGLNSFIRRRFGAHWSFVPMDVDMLTETACITDVIRALRAMLERTPAADTGGEVAYAHDAQSD